MNARMGQQSAAHGLRLVQTHATEIGPGHALNLVMSSEAFIEHRPVGIDEIAERQVAPEHLRDEVFCLPTHRRFEFGVVFGIELGVRFHHTDFATRHHCPVKSLRNRPDRASANMRSA